MEESYEDEEEVWDVSSEYFDPSEERDTVQELRLGIPARYELRPPPPPPPTIRPPSLTITTPSHLTTEAVRKSSEAVLWTDPSWLSQRDQTNDSFHGSIESMDSLTESYWDPEDDSSQLTPLANNCEVPKDFFGEHVDFLRIQTRPRTVEVVWRLPKDKY